MYCVCVCVCVRTHTRNCTHYAYVRHVCTLCAWCIYAHASVLVCILDAHTPHTHASAHTHTHLCTCIHKLILMFALCVALSVCTVQNVLSESKGNIGQENIIKTLLVTHIKISYLYLPTDCFLLQLLRSTKNKNWSRHLFKYRYTHLRIGFGKWGILWNSK